LAKVLQANRYIEVLSWDDNGISVSGYHMFLVGLSKNQTLKEMLLPLNDINAGGKEKEKEMTKIINEIQQCMFKISTFNSIQANKKAPLVKRPSRRQQYNGKAGNIDTGHASILFGQLNDQLDNTDELTPQEIEVMKKELSK